MWRKITRFLKRKPTKISLKNIDKNQAEIKEKLGYNKVYTVPHKELNDAIELYKNNARILYGKQNIDARMEMFNAFTDITFRTKENLVIRKIISLLCQSGLTTIKADTLCDKLSCSKSVVNKAVKKIKDSRQILVAYRLQGGKNNYVFVDKLNRNFAIHSNLLFNMSENDVVTMLSDLTYLKDKALNQGFTEFYNVITHNELLVSTLTYMINNGNPLDYFAENKEILVLLTKQVLSQEEEIKLITFINEKSKQLLADAYKEKFNDDIRGKGNVNDGTSPYVREFYRLLYEIDLDITLNISAVDIAKEFERMVLGYGSADEYRFALKAILSMAQSLRNHPIKNHIKNGVAYFKATYQTIQNEGWGLSHV